jgi:hypothetical protein
LVLDVRRPLIATAFAATFRDRRLAALLLLFLEISSSRVEAVLPLSADSAGTLTPSGIGLLFTYAAILGLIFQLPLVQASARMNGLPSC